MLETPPETEQPTAQAVHAARPERVYVRSKPKHLLPGSTALPILGLFALLVPLLGVILAATALLLAQRATRDYLHEPDAYAGYANVNAGRLLATLSFILHILAVGGGIAYLLLTNRMPEEWPF